ncbi:hypothetical protein GCM10020219_026680 [Nonomuraea dietziae]
MKWPRRPLAPEPQALSNLLQENRRFEPPAALAAAANVTAAAYTEGRGGPPGVLGARGGPADLGQALGHHS